MTASYLVVSSFVDSNFNGIYLITDKYLNSDVFKDLTLKVFGRFLCSTLHPFTPLCTPCTPCTPLGVSFAPRCTPCTPLHPFGRFLCSTLHPFASLCTPCTPLGVSFAKSCSLCTPCTPLGVSFAPRCTPCTSTSLSGSTNCCKVSL